MSDPIDHDFERGMRNRRRILGDAWVDRSLDKSNSFNAEFQNLITRFAWHEIWGRPGLEARARRMIVLAITMALGRWEEFELHVHAALKDDSASGLSVAELKEVLMQASIYAGVPAANTAFSMAQAILKEHGHTLEPAAPSACVHPGVGRDDHTHSAPSIHYTVREARSGKPPRCTVVLSHALGCDLTMWDELANALAQDCRVIAYDHRGHGASASPLGPYSMEDLAEDAARLLGELDTGPVLWVGISMGGMVGQELALRHPALVAGLVIANSTSHYPDSAQEMWRARIAKVEDGGLAAIADAVMERYFHEAFRKEQPATVARFRRRVVATNAGGYLACCAAIKDVDTSARLGRIGVPTLVVAGELDMGTPLPMSQAIADAIAGARLLVLPNAAHLSVIEQPQLFYAAVAQMVNNIS